MRQKGVGFGGPQAFSSSDVQPVQGAMGLRPSHLEGDMSVLSIMWRRFDITDTSFIHACIVLIIGTLIVLSEAPLAFWTWNSNYFLEKTSPRQIILFSVSCFYYAYDTVSAQLTIAPFVTSLHRMDALHSAAAG